VAGERRLNTIHAAQLLTFSTQSAITRFSFDDFVSAQQKAGIVGLIY
jgi:hypothetical protein